MFLFFQESEQAQRVCVRDFMVLMKHRVTSMRMTLFLWQLDSLPQSKMVSRFIDIGVRYVRIQLTMIPLGFVSSCERCFDFERKRRNVFINQLLLHDPNASIVSELGPRCQTISNYSFQLTFADFLVDSLPPYPLAAEFDTVDRTVISK